MIGDGGISAVEAARPDRCSAFASTISQSGVALASKENLRSLLVFRDGGVSIDIAGDGEGLTMSMKA